jgi:YfiH family protein
MPTKTLPKNREKLCPAFPGKLREDVLAFTMDGSFDLAYQSQVNRLTPRQKRILQGLKLFDADKLVNIRQVHGRRIGLITKKNSFKKQYKKTDGLLTDLPGVPLAIRTADCVPVFLYDRKKRVAGIVHAGWKGTFKRIAAKAVREMKRKWKSKPKDIIAAFGPSIQPCCYQMGQRTVRNFPKEVTVRKGRPYLDLPLANRRQLLAEGVRAKNIFEKKLCTCCNRRFYSYRRQAEKAGRMLSVIMIK